METTPLTGGAIQEYPPHFLREKSISRRVILDRSVKADIQQLEHLSSVFSQVMAHIFLAPYSNDTFNEMTGAQKKILFFLSVEGPQKMSDLARQISVTMSGATGIVDRLVKAGLVKRENDPNDRRVILIELTPAGSTTVKEIHRMHERRLEEVLENLDAEQRQDLIAAFDRIHQLLTTLPIVAEGKNPLFR